MPDEKPASDRILLRRATAEDIPLLSVLISPIWGFTPDDLAQIRMARKGDAF